ncbi:putative ubiquitin-conjugating enzyme E2 38 isoform X1 [Helianthus annuus]|uniref:Putative ubiquitin-conjugating enzyme/RWD-like protein n=1 Tax=Helianthus annuus TaxID=4232 RepID=A0A251V4G4_HELAN|nr:putative ubiquitin-conjugating enzyme E2 38 isoform X1 [Helianthus annuus]
MDFNNSVAMRKRNKCQADFDEIADRVKEIDLCDEDLNDAVDNICKGIMDYICLVWSPAFRYDFDPYFRKKPCFDTRGGSGSRCSQFLAFSQHYRSKFDKFMKIYSRVGIYPKEDVLPAARLSPPIAIDEDVLERYKSFKRFDTVVDHSDHLFSKLPIEQTTEGWAKNIREEWRILRNGLPETIFVRAYESRMDLLRAVIIGAKGTPYHDGLFVFDVYIPSMYPLVSPLVRYHSFGFAINPHLFECGELRIYLSESFGQFSKTLWPSDDLTMLQFLVSIQERVLNADPLFHQPGFVDSGPSVAAKYLSLLYNEDILIKSLKTMIYIMNKPPKNFEAFVVGHFRNRVVDILMACNAYRDGLAQAGGGGGNKEESCCSMEFQKKVHLCIYDLGTAFRKIGATEALEHLSPRATCTWLYGYRRN